jgi:hypothetical protein
LEERSKDREHIATIRFYANDPGAALKSLKGRS